GRVEAPEGLPRRELPRRLLRQVAQPLAGLVLDGGLRQPREGTQLPRAPRDRLGGKRQVVRPRGRKRGRIGPEEPVDEERERGRSARRRDEEDEVEEQHVRHVTAISRAAASANSTDSSGVTARFTPSTSQPGSSTTTGRPGVSPKPISASVP